MSGDLNEAYAETFREYASDHDRIAVSSPGGGLVHGLRLGYFIVERDMTLVIDDICLSACANYLLPAAEIVEFGPDAVVGYHQDAVVSRMVYLRDFNNADGCYSRVSNLHRRLYVRAERNPTFSEETFDRLQPLTARAEDIGDACPVIEFDFVHDIWFPTSDQLRDLMGLEFSGTICADDPACMHRRLRALRIEGTVMVGDEIWTLPLQ